MSNLLKGSWSKHKLCQTEFSQFGRLYNCLKIISLLLRDWQKLTFPVQNTPASQLFLWQMAPFLGIALQFLAHIHPSLLWIQNRCYTGLISAFHILKYSRVNWEFFMYHYTTVFLLTSKRTYQPLSEGFLSQNWPVALSNLPKNRIYTVYIYFLWTAKC